MIEVLDKTFWHFGADNSGLLSGLSGQVTKCRYKGCTFYVRENVTAIASFTVSSSERWGDKIGNMPRKQRQSLELLCDVRLWDYVATLVHAADPLKRPVRKTKTFNQSFVENLQWTKKLNPQ